MKPLEVWTFQRAKNLKKKLSKIQKNNYAATNVSAARRPIIGGGGAPLQKIGGGAPKISGGGAPINKVGGGAHKLSAAAAAHGSNRSVPSQESPVHKLQAYNSTKCRSV